MEAAAGLGTRGTMTVAVGNRDEEGQQVVMDSHCELEHTVLILMG